MQIGAGEIFIIIFVLVLLMGSKRLEKFAKDAGGATKEFKKIKNEFSKAYSETTSAINNEIKEIDKTVKEITPKKSA